MESSKSIFVFGSNLAGRHGRGAAFIAWRGYGAILGRGEGIQGDSYAIPTKDEKLQVLELRDIKSHVDKFLRYSKKNSDVTFKVTALGTGLAGYDHEDIAPMFAEAPLNCILPIKWQAILPEVEGRQWWIS